MELVQFLIAGAQKCGTTALDGYLRQHPSISLPRSKEAHFFDQEEGFCWRSPDYVSLESNYGPGMSGKRGEATPVTLYWTPAHYRILAYNKDMRFIVMVRPPADRAFSHWRMNRRNNIEPLMFAEAIRDGRKRVLDGGGPRVRAGSGPNGLHRIFSYVERGFYGRQIEQLASLFEMDRILVLQQSDLLADPSSTLQRVTSFLDIEPLEHFAPVHLNASEKDGAIMDFADRTYLDALYADDLAFFRSLTGIKLPCSQTADAANTSWAPNAT